MAQNQDGRQMSLDQRDELHSMLFSKDLQVTLASWKAVVAAATTLGTTLSDFLDRTVELSYRTLSDDFHRSWLPA